MVNKIFIKITMEVLHELEKVFESLTQYDKMSMVVFAFG